MIERSQVVDLLRRHLSEISPRPLRGGELSVLVKTSFPDFNALEFGARNLRDFIRKYIPEISETGRAGTDIVYALSAQQQPLFGSVAVPGAPSPDNRGPLGQLLTNPRVWRTFANPETLYRLFLNPISGAMRVLRPNENPEPSWHEIHPMAAETLLQIARDFIAEIPEQQRAALLATLDQQRWWFPYFELLSTLGLKSRWISFRRRRIAEEFERSIPKIVSPPPGLIPQPAQRIIPDQSKAASAAPSDRGESLIRRVAFGAIQRMTDSELRELDLPLGYVIDVLTTK